MKSPMLKSVFSRNRKSTENLRFLVKMGSKCRASFSGPQEAHPCTKDVFWRIERQNRRDGLTGSELSVLRTPTNNRVNSAGNFAYARAKIPSSHRNEILHHGLGTWANDPREFWWPSVHAFSEGGRLNFQVFPLTFLQCQRVMHSECIDSDICTKTTRKQDCLSVESLPHVYVCMFATLVWQFAHVTLTLLPWPWYMKVIKNPRCTCIPKIKFLGQCFQELEPEQNRQAHTHRHTGRRGRTHYHATFAGGNDVTACWMQGNWTKLHE